MNSYQGITLSDDQIKVVRARLRMRVEQAIMDMPSAAYDPGTIAHLLQDLEALSRFDSPKQVEEGGETVEEVLQRPARTARRGH